MQHLILALEAPMMSFGAHATDNYGPTRAFPGLSAITGLLGNALGWSRNEPDRLQTLQDSLVIGSRIDRDPLDGQTQMDYQTAKINANDTGWTTQDTRSTRSGDRNTFNTPRLRFREYIADGRITTALRIEPRPGDTILPSNDEMAQALIRPARPLFIGRKPFIPSTLIFQQTCEADNILQALLTTPVSDLTELPDPVRLSWPPGEGDAAAAGVYLTDHYHLSDIRNWHTRIYSGRRPVLEGTAPRTTFQFTAHQA